MLRLVLKVAQHARATAIALFLRFGPALPAQEKEVSRLVVTAFKQGVCGFDLLRSDKVCMGAWG